MDLLRQSLLSLAQLPPASSAPSSPSFELRETQTFPGSVPTRILLGRPADRDTPPTRLTATSPPARIAPSDFLSVDLDAQAMDESEKYDKYFHEIGCGYKKLVDYMYIEPAICQPTPAGLSLLVEDFVVRTNHDLRAVDQQKSDGPVPTMIARFKEFSTQAAGIRFDPLRPVGVILTHGQHHACPVLFMRKGQTNYVLIFDSTSGSMKKAYRKVGTFFPDCQVLLNDGTRQSDSQSCITDAYEILTRAFTVDDLIGKVEERIADECSASSSTAAASRVFRFSAPEVDNFRLFRMPEELCFTAQRTAFVTQTSKAKLQLPIRDRTGRLTTLKDMMRLKKTVAIGNQSEKWIGINSYLHEVSLEHRERIKQLVDQRAVDPGPVIDDGPR
ncbi:hypothetical protein QN362_18025 [Actimicrobium sp. CCC2.4]|uniref:hypothetical protein n=1 Tax=Actimicrobium sp. CCC2.4 TaxID=3048606 RepID=UPI002AC94379|nr:hypothetical protein [Actimicrobium sp. CCC2.4]MEB0137235.1 hypothetical protein [Actimicrobium sp. CCC2.4]WPX33498.1 hypothetical protein RHM62_06625 [Actimicrobium sp. CCC2.4]